MNAQMHKPCKTENLHVDIQLNIVIAKTVTHFHKNQHIYIWFNYKRSVQIKKKSSFSNWSIKCNWDAVHCESLLHFEHYMRSFSGAT